MQLSKRLEAVAALCMRCDCLADIGTDHGYIPIWLCQNNRIKRAIAMDVNKGPLERADANILAYNLKERITTRLSDGLHALQAGEAQGIVVAGMGGALTIRILEEGQKVADSLDYMVLQPQSEIHLVRRYLCEHGFQIVDEDMIFEDGKYYPMMLVKKQSTVCALKEEEYHYGPVLIQKMHPVLLQFLEKEMESLIKIETELKKSDSERTRKRLDEMDTQKKLIESILMRS